MKILYLTSACAQLRFDRLVAQKLITKMPQAQKYHHLLLEGLQTIQDTEIDVLSSYPITGGRKVVYNTEVEIESGIKYTYPGFIKFPIIRQVCLIINTFLLILKKQKKDTIIVCDVLNGSVCYAARFARLFSGVKVVGIVTDVPGLTSGARAKMLPWWKKIIIKFSTNLLKRSLGKYDGYLLLTKAMNDVVNFNHKPYIVIEGHSDIKMGSRVNNLSDKSKERIIMYAGGTHKEFGIGLLVEAFIAIDNKDWYLHIYGDGNYQEELKRISLEYPHVVYHGMKPNSEVVEKQLQSWVMVNPRITNAEYIKYSFPSKTLECMVSGTPLLTTKLAGMPKDYYPYVYLFENETLEGFKSALEQVFALEAADLHHKGTKAKEFALSQKNNVIQAEKFYKFLKTIK